jgi:hypothetical protein
MNSTCATRAKSKCRTKALSLAKLAAAEQQQIVQGIRQTLIALSELLAIRAKDTQGCNAYLSEISGDHGRSVSS